MRNLISRLRNLPANTQPEESLPADFEKEREDVFRKVQPFTMTSIERIYHLISSVEYVVKSNLHGAIVECGVWRGGSMMCVALTLLRLGDIDRDLFLFDTFEGMTKPESVDTRYDGVAATEILSSRKKSKDDDYWAYSPLDDVRNNMLSTGYPANRIHLIKGDVEQTIPNMAPSEIALLRLDTDWYSSTRHELVYLYPRLVANGPFIIDDYGWWQGARQAVEEYFNSLETRPLLHRIDATARAGVKSV